MHCPLILRHPLGDYVETNLLQWAKKVYVADDGENEDVVLEDLGWVYVVYWMQKISVKQKGAEGVAEDQVV